MNLQQLRYVSEVAHRNLNVSEAAEALHTSQPGVSKQIRGLEDELGVAIFVRQGRRFTALTDAGREIVTTIDRALAEVANLKSVGDEFAHRDVGTLAVGVTHTQARYALPPIVTAFKKRFPRVKLKLLQGNPHHLVTRVPQGAGRGIAGARMRTSFPGADDTPCLQARRLPSRLHGRIHPPHRAAHARAGPEAARARGGRELQHLAHWVL